MSNDSPSYRDIQSYRGPDTPPVLLDRHGRPISSTDASVEPIPNRHPQQMRPQRLQPYGRPDQIDVDHANYLAQQQPQAPNVNVAVNTNAYRPWKEELLLSAGKTVGNFFAWPFRLMGNLIEHLLMMAAGVLRIALMAVVLPTLLFAGYQFYQDHKDQPGTETAHEVGKAGVGLVGSAMKGIWDGMFGEDEPAPTTPSK